MENEINIFDLSLLGKFIYIFSDKTNHYILFANYEDNKLYCIITNKYYEIENNIYEIYNGEAYFNSEKVIFNKPLNDNFNDYIFKGFIKIDGNYYRFLIEDFNFKLDNEIIDYKNPLDNIDELKDFTINYYIQKKHMLYFVGYDNKVEDDVFIIFNLMTKKIEYLNSFYGQNKYFNLLSLNIDNDVINIVGYTEEIETKDIRPFITYIKNPIG